MKKRFKTAILICLACSLPALSACQSRSEGTVNIVRSKDYVEEFMLILQEELPKYKNLRYEDCYNVTPAEVKRETEYMIFKFSPHDESFVMVGGEVFELCESFGGYGFINAVPWDYDEDGTVDLLVASSWGSGIHRGEVSVFDMSTKQSLLVHSTMDSKVGDVCVSKKSGEYMVQAIKLGYDENYEVKEYTPTDTIGTVTVKDGKAEVTLYNN